MSRGLSPPASVRESRRESCSAPRDSGRASRFARSEGTATRTGRGLSSSFFFLRLPAPAFEGTSSASLLLRPLRREGEGEDEDDDDAAGEDAGSTLRGPCGPSPTERGPSPGSTT